MGDWAARSRDELEAENGSLRAENKALAEEVGRLRRDLHNALIALRAARGEPTIPEAWPVGS